MKSRVTLTKELSVGSCSKCICPIFSIIIYLRAAGEKKKKNTFLHCRRLHFLLASHHQQVRCYLRNLYTSKAIVSAQLHASHLFNKATDMNNWAWRYIRERVHQQQACIQLFCSQMWAGNMLLIKKPVSRLHTLIYLLNNWFLLVYWLKPPQCII